MDLADLVVENAGIDLVLGHATSGLAYSPENLTAGKR